MGWFDEQIRQRKASDQELFEDSILRMAATVLGKQGIGALDDRIVTKAAIDEILKYYHYKSQEIPDSITDIDEQLEYCLRPHGLMRRSVKLEKGWQKDAFGPMLGFLKEDGTPVALLPNPFAGYWFSDPVTGEKTRVTAATAERFRPDAICFYRPLPLKKLGIPDLILYMKNCLSTGDFVLLIALTLLVTLFGIPILRITRLLTGFVLDSGSTGLLLGTAVFMVCAIVSSQLIGTVRELMMNRVEIKTSLSVEAAMMMRLMNLPANFFRKYASGELSSRADAVNQLCSLLLGSVFSLGLTSLSSLLYVPQIFNFAPALVVPALGIIAVSLAFSLLSSFRQMKISRQMMEKGAKENGISYALKEDEAGRPGKRHELCHAFRRSEDQARRCGKARLCPLGRRLYRARRAQLQSPAAFKGKRGDLHGDLAGGHDPDVLYRGTDQGQPLGGHPRPLRRGHRGRRLCLADGRGALCGAYPPDP